jgi:hypothetical protein
VEIATDVGSYPRRNHADIPHIRFPPTRGIQIRFITMENTMTGRGTDEQTSETLKFRMVTHVTTAQSLDIGDVDGHAASLARFSGLALFPDGSVGTVCFASLADYTNGAGTFTLFPILTFDDGSVLWIKSVGTGTVDGTKTRFIGTLTVVGGKGRFDGAKGDGTLTGTRYTPLSVGADLISDYTVNIKR